MIGCLMPGKSYDYRWHWDSASVSFETQYQKNTAQIQTQNQKQSVKHWTYCDLFLASVGGLLDFKAIFFFSGCMDSVTLTHVVFTYKVSPCKKYFFGRMSKKTFVVALFSEGVIDIRALLNKWSV